MMTRVERPGKVVGKLSTSAMDKEPRSPPQNKTCYHRKGIVVSNRLRIDINP